MMDPVVSRLGRTLARLSPRGPWLVAISGGADSTALLDALAQHPTPGAVLFAAHVDHGLRPDSARVAGAVAAFCASIGIRCEVARVDVDASDGGLEQGARHARLRALREAANRVGARSVLLAHTATDQAETLLWRLVRGTAAHGLRGMAEVRAFDVADPHGLALVRPLLAETRQSLREYCVRRRLEFHDDPTNDDLRPRATLRREVLPVLERLQPGATDRTAGTARLLAEDDALLDRLAHAALAESNGLVAGLRTLEAPLLRRAVVAWVISVTGTRRRLLGAHVDALVALVRTGRGEVELPADRDVRVVALVENGSLVIATRVRGGGDATR